MIFYVDNQAALKAINSDAVTSRTVLQCISSLSALVLTTRVYLRYVKAHAGHVGNEMADKAAKLASSRPTPYTRPLTYIPHSFYKSVLKASLYQAWDTRWQRSTLSQTRVWFPHLAPNKSKVLLSQPRAVFSRVVRFITGHCFLRHQRALVAGIPVTLTAPVPPAHVHAISPSPPVTPASPQLLISPTVSPASIQLTPPPQGSPEQLKSPGSLERVKTLNPAIICRRCHRHKERAVDVITTCEFYWDTRLRSFGAFTISAITPQWSPVELLRFLADPRIIELEEDET